MTKERTFFHDRLADLRRIGSDAEKFSGTISRKRVSEREAWTSWLLLKLCNMGHSLRVLCAAEERIMGGEVCTLDQSSIMSIARSMVETAIMLAYVSDESATEDDWRLRRTLLCLHDCTTRYKMFKGWKDRDQIKSLKGQMEELRGTMEGLAAFKALPEERRQKLLSGDDVYVNGIRAAARLAGWKTAEFNAFYAYMSGHAHGSPVSFMRIDEHGVDYKRPTDAQYAIAGFAVEHASGSLEFGLQRSRRVFLDVLLTPPVPSLS